MKQSITCRRERRMRGVRSKIAGTKDRPRLAVFRSNKHIYVQLIDDVRGQTIIALSDQAAKGGGSKTEKALALGRKLAAKALKAGLKRVVFDRRHYQYHGRVKALAEGAREEGLEF